MRPLLCLLLFVYSVGAQSQPGRQVEIIRTAHGVPHIRAENFRAAGYALAWIQCEDYGTRTPIAILQSSGRWASVEGTEDHVESDFFILRHRARTLSKYNLLSKDVRDVYEGFAAGVNRYIELHRADFPAGMPSDLTAQDVAATDMIAMNPRKVRNFVNKLIPPQTMGRMFESPQRRGDAELEMLGELSVLTDVDDGLVNCSSFPLRLCVSAGD